jgi:hypothetical protein
MLFLESFEAMAKADSRSRRLSYFVDESTIYPTVFILISPVEVLSLVVLVNETSNGVPGGADFIFGMAYPVAHLRNGIELTT